MMRIYTMTTNFGTTIHARIQAGKSSKKSPKKEDEEVDRMEAEDRMAQTGLTKIKLQNRKPLKLPLVKWRTTRTYPKYARECEIT